MSEAEIRAMIAEFLLHQVMILGVVHVIQVPEGILVVGANGHHLLVRVDEAKLEVAGG